jgi:imidazolonepropionase
LAFDVLIRHASVATMDASIPGPYGALHDAAVGIRGGSIAWVGSDGALPSAANAHREIDATGQWLTPGLIDCHTHLVYAGNRANEFEQRLAGVSYADIARAGGGIVSTVRATRAASGEELIAQSLPRLSALQAEGVTTIEIKSGYGLDTPNELKMLRVARRLGTEQRIDVRTTFLGAHALPPEFSGRADDYIGVVCDQMLPAAANAGLADAVDAFCENIGFTNAQTRRVFEAAWRLGLPVKLHAEQLSDQGGAALAAEFSALSADHLEHVSEDGVAAMARAGTVAVLLPGAFYFLRDTTVPPVGLLRDHGVAIAVASDCNPGSSPVTSLLLCLNMACTLFRLTPSEALAGTTRHAARALGLDDRGVVAPGKRADLALWRIGHPAELAYHLGYNPLSCVVQNGHLVSR